jgi:hypothetical protein
VDMSTRIARRVAWSVVGVYFVLAAILSLFLRLRRASGEERQQVKWFVYAQLSTRFTFPLFCTWRSQDQPVG